MLFDLARRLFGRQVLPELGIQPKSVQVGPNTPARKLLCRVKCRSTPGELSADRSLERWCLSLGLDRKSSVQDAAPWPWGVCGGGALDKVALPNMGNTASQEGCRAAMTSGDGEKA